MPSSFGALGVGVAGRDECEHTAHRESAVQQSEFSLHLSACCATCASVVVIHLVLYRRNVPCHFHGGFPRSFPGRLAVARVPSHTSTWTPRLVLGVIGDLTLSAYFLLAVTLKELTLCGLGLTHSGAVFHHSR